MKAKTGFLLLLPLILTSCGNSTTTPNSTSDSSTASSDSVSSGQDSSDKETTTSYFTDPAIDSSVNLDEVSYQDYKKYFPSYRATEAEFLSAKDEHSLNTHYNIIMTAATVPPVLAALQSIENGYETYAWIERGNTYRGIDKTTFHNIGFEPTKNLSVGNDENSHTLVKSTIESLNLKGDEHFDIYVTDYNVMSAALIAMENHLSDNQWTINMMSDGSATGSLYKTMWTQTGWYDEDNYKHFYERKDEALQMIIDAKNGNTTQLASHWNEFMNGYNFSFPLALDSHFQYFIQSDFSTTIDEGKMKDLVDPQKTPLNLHIKSISEHIASLSSEQKTEYQTLMFGDLQGSISSTMNRTTLSDGVTAVPSKKLVFIGGRVRQSNIGFVPNISSLTEIPEDYASLSEINKEVFNKESDYISFRQYLFNDANFDSVIRSVEGVDGQTTVAFSALTQEEKNAIRVSCFNYYAQYVYNLKYTYRLYGQEYDIILKGHPAEVLEDASTFSGYTASVDEVGSKVTMDFSSSIASLAHFFHDNDSEGKYVALVNNGFAAENLAYLDSDVSVCGFPSSTYSGWDEDRPILFVLRQDENATSADQDVNLADKFNKFGLSWNVEGEETKIQYLNRGNFYSSLENYYKDSDSDLSSSFQTKKENWMKTTYSLEDLTDYSLDNYGRLLHSGQLVNH